MDIWAHAVPSVIAAFLGSLVEFVEALTMVLAVGTVRGWHPALFGTFSGVAVLAGSMILLGPILLSIEIRLVQLTVGSWRAWRWCSSWSRPAPPATQYCQPASAPRLRPFSSLHLA